MSGCFIGGGPMEHAGALQTESVSVPLGAARSVHAHLQMAAGELRISGGSTQLVDGSITYNVPEWKPDLSYSVNGDEGDLMVMQPESHENTFGGVKYRWDLHFNNNVPLGLAVEMGAGDSHLNLAGVQLRNLTVKVGAGNARIDLAGNWKQDVDVDIEGGVGEVHLNLPRGMGVRVSVNGGLGSVDAPDFKRSGSEYTNDAYGKGGPAVNVTINGGIGQVDLTLGGAPRGIV